MKAELERLTKACATTEQQIHTPQQNQTAAGAGAGAGAGAAAPGAELPPAKKMRIADGSSATTDDAGGGGGGGGGGRGSNANGSGGARPGSVEYGGVVLRSRIAQERVQALANGVNRHSQVSVASLDELSF